MNGRKNRRDIPPTPSRDRWSPFDIHKRQELAQMASEDEDEEDEGYDDEDDDNDGMMENVRLTPMQTKILSGRTVYLLTKLVPYPTIHGHWRAAIMKELFARKSPLGRSFWKVLAEVFPNWNIQ